MIGSEDIGRVQEIRKAEGSEAACNAIDILKQKVENDDDHGSLILMKSYIYSKDEKFDQAIQILEDGQDFFTCKSVLYSEIATHHYRAGRIDDAIKELEKIPFEDDLEKYEGLVHDARFFYFYLLSAHRGVTITDEQIALFREGYIQLTDRGQRIGLEYLTPEYRDYEY